jgi:hypothetical protein
MSALTVTQVHETVRLGLAGPLDETIAEQLVELTQVALSIGPKVVIDVSAVTVWTSRGFDALLECADLGAHVPSGTPAERSET